MAREAQEQQPWYRRVMRWGQANIREIDALPGHYDVGWWVEHWRRTRVQGVIVNAGGIVAFYPSALELHRRSPYLDDRDLFGEVTAAARENGIVVVAHMDSSRANERFYFEHPDWFTVDAAGQPYLAGDFDGPFYTACISGPYYREYLPRVLREICERYRPEGFSDNSWSGLSRSAGICYCPNYRAAFAEYSGGQALPPGRGGETSLYDESGDRRRDFGLASLFGAHAAGGTLAAAGREPSYFRFVDPPGERPQPLALGPTGAFTAGWEDTLHLPFGGDLTLTRPAGAGERVPLTYVPPFPTHPPEFAYMKIERTGLPCLYLRQEQSGQGRVAYLPADVDRLYWRLSQPDHAELLAALVRWVAYDHLPVRVTGPGLVDVHAYTQAGSPPGPDARPGVETGARVIVHLVNLTHAGTWKAPVDELIRVGEQHVALRLPQGRRAAGARLLVAGGAAPLEMEDDTVIAVVPGIDDHEVVVVELED